MFDHRVRSITLAVFASLVVHHVCHASTIRQRADQLGTSPFYPPGFDPPSCPRINLNVWPTPKFCQDELSCRPAGGLTDVDRSSAEDGLTDAFSLSSGDAVSMVDRRGRLCVFVAQINFTNAGDFILTPKVTTTGGLDYWYSWQTNCSSQTMYYYKDKGPERKTFKRKSINTEGARRGTFQINEPTNQEIQFEVSLQPSKFGCSGELALFRLDRTRPVAEATTGATTVSSSKKRRAEDRAVRYRDWTF